MEYHQELYMTRWKKWMSKKKIQKVPNNYFSHKHIQGSSRSRLLCVCVVQTICSCWKRKIPVQNCMIHTFCSIQSKHHKQNLPMKKVWIYLQYFWVFWILLGSNWGIHYFFCDLNTRILKHWIYILHILKYSKCVNKGRRNYSKIFFE